MWSLTFLHLPHELIQFKFDMNVLRCRTKSGVIVGKCGTIRIQNYTLISKINYSQRSFDNSHWSPSFTRKKSVYQGTFTVYYDSTCSMLIFFRDENDKEKHFCGFTFGWTALGGPKSRIKTQLLPQTSVDALRKTNQNMSQHFKHQSFCLVCLISTKEEESKWSTLQKWSSSVRISVLW